MKQETQQSDSIAIYTPGLYGLVTAEPRPSAAAAREHRH